MAGILALLAINTTLIALKLYFCNDYSVSISLTHDNKIPVIAVLEIIIKRSLYIPIIRLVKYLGGEKNYSIKSLIFVVIWYTFIEINILLVYVLKALIEFEKEGDYSQNFILTFSQILFSQNSILDLGHKVLFVNKGGTIHYYML